MAGGMEGRKQGLIAGICGPGASTVGHKKAHERKAPGILGSPIPYGIENPVCRHPAFVRTLADI